MIFIHLIFLLTAANSRPPKLVAAANLPELDSARIGILRESAVAGVSDSAVILCMYPVARSREYLLRKEERIFWMTKLWSEGHSMGLNLESLLGSNNGIKSLILRKINCPQDSSLRAVLRYRLKRIGELWRYDSACSLK